MSDFSLSEASLVCSSKAPSHAVFISLPPSCGEIPAGLYLEPATIGRDHNSKSLGLSVQLKQNPGTIALLLQILRPLCREITIKIRSSKPVLPAWRFPTQYPRGNRGDTHSLALACFLCKRTYHPACRSVSQTQIQVAGLFSCPPQHTVPGRLLHLPRPK